MKLYALAMVACLACTSAYASQGSCAGQLVENNGYYYLSFQPEGACEFDEAGERAVSLICSVGHYCEVTGETAPCDEECIKIVHVKSIKSGK